MQTDPVPQFLVVDDEPTIRELLSSILKAEGYEVVAVDTAEAGCRVLAAQTFTAVFSDLSLSDQSGLEILRFLQKHDPDTPGIIVSASSSHEMAVQVMRTGVFDYITKPFRPSDITDAARRVLAMRRERALAPQAVSPMVGRTRNLRKLIGKSEAMRELNSLIERVAFSNSTVLIRGESGTGKELVARALHERSHRANRPLIPVNCGAIPEDLLESELFGHVKGAFTGAISDRVGRFVLADKGTIFLDEIGDMSPRLQTKVLRVLQEQELEPVGSTETIRVDVRVLAATNVDLERAIEEKRFREDLYYRLNVIPIETPPLRDRLDDLPILIRHFVKVFNRNSRRSIEDFAPETIRMLQEADWPGNVRELENLVERMSILAQGPIVTPEDLPPKFRTSVSVSHTLRASCPDSATLSNGAAFYPDVPQEPAETRIPTRGGDSEGINPDERRWLYAAPHFSETLPAVANMSLAAPDAGYPADAAKDREPGLMSPVMLSEKGIDLYAVVDEFERNMIFEALRMSRGIKSRAAELLGIKRTTLVEKMKKKNIVYEK